MGKLVAASGPVIALLWPCTHGFIGFQAVLLLLQQNWNVGYLQHFDLAARPNGKPGRVSRNTVDHFQVAI